MARKLKKVWLVEHPTYRYKEDVKDLAEVNRLVIYDKRFAKDIDPKMVEEKPPKLTLKDEYKKAPAKKKAEGDDL